MKSIAGGDRRCGRARADPEVFDQLGEALQATRQIDHLVCRRRVAQQQRAPQIEPFDDRPEVDAVERAR
jgi:hypothetical protein